MLIVFSGFLTFLRKLPSHIRIQGLIERTDCKYLPCTTGYALNCIVKKYGLEEVDVTFDQNDWKCMSSTNFYSKQFGGKID